MNIVPVVARALTTSNQRIDAETETLIPFDTTQITSAANRSNPQSGDPCHPLAAGAHAPAIAYAIQAGATRENPDSGPDGIGVQADIAYTLEARAEVQAVADTLTSNWHKSNGAIAGNSTGVINPVFHGAAVRRLTPRECERLQGFPDEYTLINVRGKPAADGPRYKALGNSMAVNVMRHIGNRIQLVDSLDLNQEVA